MSQVCFYDAHCHALTLSHPSFLSYIEMVRHRRLETLYSQMSSPNYLVTSLFAKAGDRIRNMLAVMENDVGSIFSLMEDDLAGTYAKLDDPPPLLQGGELRLGRLRFDRLVLVPLIMDFEERNSPPTGTYYDKSPAKPVDAQVRDVLSGIREYRHRRPEGFLEIRPFIGVNTINHSLDSLRALLRRAFEGFHRDKGASREAFLGMRTYRDEEDAPLRFAGVKLYPPLGFDPWPPEGPEREKVELLFGFCEAKGIPITTHCDDQGFRVVPLEEAWRSTSPEHWRPVLERFPGLWLDFAHFGMQYSRSLARAAPTNWAEDILGLMADYPRVYTDMSFNGSEPEYYDSLLELLDRQSPAMRELARDRIIFGSDFVVNLSKVRSYADYFRIFADSPLSDEEKRRFGQDNPERFLFGS